MSRKKPSAARRRRRGPFAGADVHFPGVPKTVMPPPGSAAGVELSELVNRAGEAVPAQITCIDYSPERIETTPVSNLQEFLDRHRPEWSRVRWIHVQGLQRLDVLRAVADKYGLHPLAIEDTLLPQQRAKTEDFSSQGDQPGRLFVLARTPVEGEDGLHSEQISFFLGRHTLITLQESSADFFALVRKRLELPTSRLRQNDVSFLFHALVDTLVDRLFPILEQISERLEEIEGDLAETGRRDVLPRLHALKRQLLLLRRVAWPMRDLVAMLANERHEMLSDDTRTYFRDVYDHCVQIMDLLESYREIAASMTETYMSMIANRMNEIMKVLTIISTIFMPLTFLCGVYGMNFENFPEIKWEYGYLAFWFVVAGIAGAMLYWFRRLGWL